MINLKGFRKITVNGILYHYKCKSHEKTVVYRPDKNEVFYIGADNSFETNQMSVPSLVCEKILQYENEKEIKNAPKKLKKYVVYGYFILIENPKKVIIETKEVEEENLRLALNGSVLDREINKSYYRLNKVAYEKGGEEPMSYLSGIAVKLKRNAEAVIEKSVPDRNDC